MALLGRACYEARMSPALRLGLLPCLLLSACGPRSSEIAMHDGILSQQAGDNSAAVEAYRKALEIAPQIPGAHNNLALVELARGELTKAIGLLEDELKQRSGEPHALLNRALIFIRLGQYDKAVADVEPIAELGSKVPPQDEHALARRDRARLLLGLARIGQDKSPDEIDEALDGVGEDATEEQPTRLALRRHARRVAGIHALAASQWERGARELAMADRQEDRVLRAAAQIRLGQGAEALRVLDGVADEKRSEPWVLLLTAHAQALEGDAKAARDALAPLVHDRKAAPEAPAEIAASAWRLFASLAGAEGKWPVALGALDRVITLSAKPSAGVWLDRAVVLAHLGKLDEARVAVAGVLRDYPDDARARELQKLLK